jgi:pimeloyl-ACP methyl ester carboxylesterase
VQAMQDFDCTQYLHEIKCETLVINGNEDLIFIPEESKQSFHNIPNANFEIVNSAAHSIHVEQPGEFCKIVLDFLS